MNALKICYIYTVSSSPAKERLIGIVVVKRIRSTSHLPARHGWLPRVQVIIVACHSLGALCDICPHQPNCGEKAGVEDIWDQVRERVWIIMGINCSRSSN